MRVLVTGGNGFIGSHLVECLIRQGKEVRCLVRKTSRLTWIEQLPMQWVYGDVSDADSLRSIVQNVDYVYHLGGIVRARSEEEFNRVNFEGTKNLLEACRRFNPHLQRFVLVSSQAAAGPSPDGAPLTEDVPPHPISAYGRSKMKAETAVMHWGEFFPYTIIRPPSVYGRRDDDIFVIFKAVNYRVKPLIGWRNKKISLVHVDDLIRGICVAAESVRGENEVFSIANPEAYDWLDIMNAISRSLGTKAVTVRIPETLLSFMAVLSEKLARLRHTDAVFNSDKANEMKQHYWLISSDKAARLLGFVTHIDLEQGLKDTAHWYKDQGWL